MPLSRQISQRVTLCLEKKKKGIRLYLMSGSERLAISHPLRGVEQSELGVLRHCLLCLSKRYHRLTYQKCRIQWCVYRKWVIKGRTQCDLLLKCPLLSNRSSRPDPEDQIFVLAQMTQNNKILKKKRKSASRG